MAATTMLLSLLFGCGSDSENKEPDSQTGGIVQSDSNQMIWDEKKWDQGNWQ